MLMTRRCPTCKRTLDIKEFGITVQAGKAYAHSQECRICRVHNVKGYIKRHGGLRNPTLVED